MNGLTKKQSLWLRGLSWAGLMGIFALLAWLGFPARKVNAQQPTGSIPTVTGTPSGPFVQVYPYTSISFIGVYAGPGTDDYPQVGILMVGQSAPALGYSIDGKWIEIIYLGVQGGKGWIYAANVSLTPGAKLPQVESPATATPATTPTLDPTYVAAFGLTLIPTQLPTFTSPGALQIPTFAAPAATGSSIPFGLIIVGLIFIGVLGAVVSFLRGSR